MVRERSLPDFSAAKVLVVGDVMLDSYWYGQTHKISPEAPVPVVNVVRDEIRPGGAGNVAKNLAQLGASVRVLGITGKDSAAEELKASLNTHKVKCEFVATPQGTTIKKLRIISNQQQMIRLDFDGELTFTLESIRLLTQRFYHHLNENWADIIVFSDYGKGTLRAIEALISAAKQAGIPCIVDPKGTNFKRYAGASLMTPNLLEFEGMLGKHCPTLESLEEAGRALIREGELKALLVTRSEKGMSLITANNNVLHLAATTQEVFDVTGAGDTVIAVCAAALAVKEPLERAAFWANTAAGIVVGKFGTSGVSQEELINCVDRLVPKSQRKIIQKTELLQVVTPLRTRGLQIVMTNGCFDLLHAGHVSYLHEAKALGDILIVAVNSDESVRALKGASRPILPLAYRMALLASLIPVDWVVDFDELTPESLIAAILPDLLVKGADYAEESIAGADLVRNAGGKVITLPLTPGVSTSSIVDKIRSTPV